VATPTKVTRITAKDDASKAPVKAVKSTKKAVKAEKPARVRKAGKRSIFGRIWGYFKGAWQELRLVRWPNRRATWGLTLAVIVFSLFFVLIILLLDALFKYLFELIIA